MVRIDLDTEEWCESCGRATFHRTEHERLRGPGIFYRLRIYCLKCGHLTREVSFK